MSDADPIDVGQDGQGHSEDDNAVVVSEWALIAIDAVDNPSFRAAWLLRESAGKSAVRPSVGDVAMGLLEEHTDTGAAEAAEFAAVADRFFSAPSATEFRA